MNTRSLYFIVFAKALLMALYVQFSGLGLAPDEAQYWTWSQELSFGYYSKPPGIAWQIFATTSIFGNTELGVRASAILIAILITFATYRLARACQLNHPTSSLAAAMMALTPLGFGASLVATTDGGSIFFLTLALGYCVRKESIDPIRVGGLIACAALFKWTAYLLFPFLLMMGNMPRREILKAMAISLLGLIPSLVWNIDNDYATFRHVFHTMTGRRMDQSGGSAPANPLEFLLAQVGLLSPVLFFLLMGSYWKLLKKPLRAPLQLLGSFSLAILSITFIFSCFQKMQGNWGAYVYPSALVFLAATQPPRPLRVGLGISLLLVGPLLIAAPFKAMQGWSELEPALNEFGYRPDEHYLVSDKYQTTSLLSFYGETQKRAYFLNVNGARKNQFSYWPGLERKQPGRDGFFALILDRPSPVEPLIESYSEKLSPYFDKVEYLGKASLFEAPVKELLIFKTHGYNGQAPAESESY